MLFTGDADSSPTLRLEELLIWSKRGDYFYIITSRYAFDRELIRVLCREELFMFMFDICSLMLKLHSEVVWFLGFIHLYAVDELGHKSKLSM